MAGARTDLEGLATFDGNHDGKLSAADEQWGKFFVWQDANLTRLVGASPPARGWTM